MPEDAGRTTPLAATIMARLVRSYGGAADPARAAAMRAYMRDQFPFLGIPAPAQRVLARQVLAGLAKPGEMDLAAVALACWALPQREYQYFACGWLRRHAKVCGPGFIDIAQQLIVARAWWDTVDTLAAHLVGPLVANHPELISTIDEWSAAGDLWLVRSALLHQLTFKDATDAGRLFHYCLMQCGHPDFFIRKAIGWALREYGKVNPEAVRAFVRAHEQRLSVLSVREALKNL